MRAGLIIPQLLEDGRVCVDMGEPVLAAAEVPTTLRGDGGDGAPAVAAPVQLAGRSWTVTAVSMGNPHAVVYCSDGAPVQVRAARRSHDLNAFCAVPPVHNRQGHCTSVMAICA